VSKRPFLHFACALLLLIAQHGALTHSIWHLGGQAAAQHVETDGGFHSPDRQDRSPQSKLCDLHFAMGSLLGGDCAGQSVPGALALSHWIAASDSAWHVAQPFLSPHSRAPPVFL
jgi:hypothetical protein